MAILFLSFERHLNEQRTKDCVVPVKEQQSYEWSIPDGIFVMHTRDFSNWMIHILQLEVHSWRQETPFVECSPQQTSIVAGYSPTRAHASHKECNRCQCQPWPGTDVLFAFVEAIKFLRLASSLFNSEHWGLLIFQGPSLETLHSRRSFQSTNPCPNISGIARTARASA